MNRLFFGDNFGWLQNRAEFPNASVDLVYLDPPFNSNADYNVLFKEESGEASRAQFHAFTDTWHWADAAETYSRFIDTCPNVAAVEMMEALFRILKSSPLMAYLAMMAPRLVELHRILKPTGSLYLHCDPTASAHLKLMLDAIFGSVQFRTKITWKRSSAHSDAKQGREQYGNICDEILFYTKGSDWTWNSLFTPYSEEYVNDFYKHVETGTGRRYRLGDLTGPGGAAKGNPSYEVMGVTRYWRFSKEKMDELIAQGRVIQTKPGNVPAYKRYLDEMPGVPLQNLWDDIPPIGAQAAERLGYPTQKPVVLLERIIATSSNPNDVVLDPFCGCGTSIHAAQKLGRQWAGIDITYLAVNLIKRRLSDAFGKAAKFVEKGQPTDAEGARRLAELDKFQFQQWALSLVNARPLKEGAGKGADRGVDGLLYFYESKTERRSLIVQVKGGKAGRGDVATLVGDVNNQKAAGGVLITLEEPTKPMREEAAAAGRFKSVLWHSKDYPKIQLLTVENLLAEPPARVDAPPQGNPFAKAAGEGDGMAQGQMF